jgi:dimethylargininase
MRDQLDIQRARTQHKKYCSVLEELGLELIVLESEPSFPDCCFVEDTAIVRGNKSFIARLGAAERQGEETAVADVLRRYTTMRRAEAPATIEGGDVIHLPDSLLIGVGQRTNREGFRQLSDSLEIRTESVEDPRIFHLKSDVTYLGSDTLLTTARFAKHEELQGFNLLHVPAGEEYGANTLTVGERVLMSSRHKKTLDVVKQAGFHPLPIDMSEFEKCDGAITCLSIVL